MYQPHNYIFVEDQVKVLSSTYEVQVISTITVSFKELFKKGLMHLGISKSKTKNASIVLLLIPSIPKMKKLNNFLRYLGNKYLMKKYLKKIELIHLHSYLSGDIAIELKNKFNVPLYVTEHSSLLLENSIDSFDYNLANKVFKNSNTVFAVSRFYANKLNDKFNTECDVLHNIIDTDFFRPFNVQKDKYIFITVSNLAKVKNHKLLIESFAKEFKKIDNVELQIIGDGPEYDILIKLIKSFKLENKIKLLGYLDRSDIVKYINEASTFVMTSEYETFCIAIIEAMSMEKPIISTDFGGVISEIKNLKDCSIVAQSSEEMGKSMKSFHDKKLQHSIENRKFVINTFSKIKFLNKIANVY